MTTSPYIGSKISLISKSAIRYEGILFALDAEKSTIALSKVQIFGTEERPTENPIRPRDDVYEYIVFSASDTTDMIVCGTPQPVLSIFSDLPYDPAIVSFSKLPTNPISTGTTAAAAISQALGGADAASEAVSQVSAHVSAVSKISIGTAPAAANDQHLFGAGDTLAITPVFTDMVSSATGGVSQSSSNNPHHAVVSPSVETGVQMVTYEEFSHLVGTMIRREVSTAVGQLSTAVGQLSTAVGQLSDKFEQLALSIRPPSSSSVESMNISPQKESGHYGHRLVAIRLLNRVSSNNATKRRPRVIVH